MADTARAVKGLERHAWAFRRRRIWNRFPLGILYALLYMGRYNLTVAKNSLGDLMTKEDFGTIFFWGTLVYAFAFLVNGPLVDRIGGRRGALIAGGGAMLANFAMGGYLASALASGRATEAPLVLVFSLLYALNMYFQSFGAVSIVKVNAHWFHVSERGGFSGIFGTMISSGIFLAFTANAWLLELAGRVWPGGANQWVVFVVPAALLGVFFAIELRLLRDRPSQAGHADFDTGDASSDDTSEAPLAPLELFRRILGHPVILTVALIELCTGVLRNGVMHWFPIYAKEVWALPGHHPLVNGSWDHPWLLGACFGAAAVIGILAARSGGGRRALLVTLGGLAALAPFVQGGWGGLLFVAGVLGGNVAGWVSDLVFQSRRGPTAAGLYLLLAACTAGMLVTLAEPTAVVAEAKPKSGLVAGDRIVEIAGTREVRGWADVRAAVACWQPVCVESSWDAKECMCRTGTAGAAGASGRAAAQPGIPALVERGGRRLELRLPDPLPEQRAGDKRLLAARPVLPTSPYLLGALVFLISLCVIGTHGVLSGTATMDFGGRKGAATAVGVIDGFVYLGTALQSISLGYITTRAWAWWPAFLLPFALIGFGLCLRIWNARPRAAGGH